MSDVEKLKLAMAATRHALNAICDDPRKFYLVGNGSGTWETLTAAHAALFGVNVEEVRKNFVPDRDKYERYCEQIKTEHDALEAIMEGWQSCERFAEKYKLPDAKPETIARHAKGYR